MNTSKIISFEGLIVLVGSQELHSEQENNIRTIQMDQGLEKGNCVCRALHAGPFKRF